MTVLMETETEQAIKGFLSGATSPQDFETWIISALDDLPDAEQATLWEIRLLLTEYGERLRPLAEVKRRTAELIAELSTLQRSDSEGSTIKFEVTTSTS